jgi:hypothetical protein
MLGRIVYVSDLDGGSVHDKTQWDECGIVADLADFYRNCKATVGGQEYQFALTGDKAYVLMTKPDGWQVVVTKSATETLADNDVQNNDPRMENVKLDPGVAIYRSVVERTISRMKRWLGLMNPLLVQSFQRAQKMLHFVAALVNWEIEHNSVVQI